MTIFYDERGIPRGYYDSPTTVTIHDNMGTTPALNDLTGIDRLFRAIDESVFSLSWIRLTNKEELARLAAEKDREYWSLEVVFDWLWVYVPIPLLQSRRLMISFSGWLARVGKRRKFGN